jgi:hypothetical protein
MVNEGRYADGGELEVRCSCADHDLQMHGRGVAGRGTLASSCAREARHGERRHRRRLGVAVKRTPLYAYVAHL